MPLSVRTAGEYKRVLNVWQKIADTWVLMDSIYTKAGTKWKLTHEAQRTFFFNQTITVATANYNMRAAAVAAGWNGSAPLQATITINPGVIVRATSTAVYAFSSGSVFPPGSSLTIINNGVIVGQGGAGGRGGWGTSGAAVTAAEQGKIGGPALYVALATTLYNNGAIYAGGGGGGGGAAVSNTTVNCTCPGGGGGGARGGSSSAGGPTGAVHTVPPPHGYNPNSLLGYTNYTGYAGRGGDYSGPGVWVQYTTPHEGGSVSKEVYDGFNNEYYTETPCGAGRGGNGGGFASTGAAGGPPNIWETGWFSRGAGLGGAPGAALIGLEHVTFAATGTILGVQE